MTDTGDVRDGIIERLRSGWILTAAELWEIPGYQGPEPLTAAEVAYFNKDDQAGDESPREELTDAEKVAVEVVEHWLDGRVQPDNGPATAALLRLRRSLPDEAFKVRRFINGS